MYIVGLLSVYFSKHKTGMEFKGMLYVYAFIFSFLHTDIKLFQVI